ncbi:hypothetical protein LCGC14_2183810 [marine sediment metagenome]|uniref:Uncharacterized protein n=1 Tax=marine sediment metagenome TaxID=412755 RepID=A0A0F9DLH7_9ZZZZ
MVEKMHAKDIEIQGMKLDGFIARLQTQMNAHIEETHIGQVNIKAINEGIDKLTLTMEEGFRDIRVKLEIISQENQKERDQIINLQSEFKILRSDVDEIKESKSKINNVVMGQVIKIIISSLGALLLLGMGALIYNAIWITYY